MAWTLDQLIHMTQAQLGAVFYQLPESGCADCFDGGPDSLWQGSHWWGTRPGFYANREDAWGIVGEWRKLPGIQYNIFHNYYPGAPGFSPNEFEITPIIAGGFTLQFIQLVGPIVMAGASIAVEELAMAAEAGAATTAAGSVTTVGATETAGTAGTATATAGASGVSDISFSGITDGFDLSAVSGSGFDIADFGTGAAGAASGAADYSTSGGFDYSQFTGGDTVDTSTLYGNAADVPMPTDIPYASVPDITVSQTATSSLPSFSFDSLTGAVKQVLGIISTGESLYKLAQGKQAVPTRVGSQTITPNLNGTITTTGPTGSRTVPMQPGIPYTFPDGTTVVNNGDGTYTTIHPDGSHVTTRYPTAGGLGSLFGSSAGSSNLLMLGVGAIALLALVRR